MNKHYTIRHLFFIAFFLVFSLPWISFSQAPVIGWAKKLGGASIDIGNAIIADSAGNVYTTGFFRVTCDFDPGAGTYNLTSAGLGDIFVSNLDASGNFVWAL